MVTASRVQTWEQAIEHFQHLFAALKERQGEAQFWFRGHARSSWKLETTLERYSKDNFTFRNYYQIIMNILPEIRGLSSNKFDVLDWDSFSKASENFPLYNNFPSADYFAYLRHFGFPSPLLDWSKSLYVAAYFAFADPVFDEECAAIYVYVDRFGPTKSYIEGEPMIWLLNTHTQVQKRHYRQQSGYTVSGCFDIDNFDDVKRWRFVPHELAMSEALTRPFKEPFKNMPVQDYYHKISIPISERTKILRYLDEHNINAYSLFDTEEALLKTLAFRHFPV